MNSSNLVSICIPAYNDAARFSRALESVRSQDYKHTEIIVSDDSSTGAILEIVKHAADQRIRYIQNKPALGVPQNWNHALSLASGDIITLLHHDDFYINHQTISMVVTALCTHKADVAVTSRALFKNNLLIAKYTAKTAHLEGFCPSFPHKSLIINRIGSPSVVFVRRSLLMINYNQSLIYFSDTEYYNRLFLNASKKIVVPNALVGIDWSSEAQLSKSCIAHFDGIIQEIYYIRTKTCISDAAVGLALARLFSSNLKHFTRASVSKAVKTAWAILGLRGRSVALMAFPFFCCHMLYRLFWRLIGRGPWG